MEPTIKDGDYLLVERLSILSGNIKKWGNIKLKSI